MIRQDPAVMVLVCVNAGARDSGVFGGVDEGRCLSVRWLDMSAIFCVEEVKGYRATVTLAQS